MSSLLLSEFLRQTGGTAIIDGGLATELERHGADLNDPLWSAKCLLSSPQSHLIRQVYSYCYTIRTISTLRFPSLHFLIKLLPLHLYNYITLLINSYTCLHFLFPLLKYTNGDLRVRLFTNLFFILFSYNIYLWTVIEIVSYWT